MTIRSAILPTVAAALGFVPLSSPAHHQLDKVYERNSSVSLTGTVVQIDWVNPHVSFRLNAADASGSTVEWIVELDAPHVLQRHGWTRDTILAGQTVTVAGFRALDGAARTYAKTVTPANREALQASSDASWNWRLVGVD